jgi:HEPN domain-containing protein
MVDINKQISYWQKSAQEDWEVSIKLIDAGYIRHGLFFVHLSLEKLLKALACKHTGDIAPRMHNLLRLVELTGITMTGDQLNVLADMNAFQIEGRYPESLTTPPTMEETRIYLAAAEEVYQWLMRKL